MRDRMGEIYNFRWAIAGSALINMGLNYQKALLP